jgi:hypothetical protein
MTASYRRDRSRPWWHDWRPGRRAEALVITLLIQGLMALTLVVAYRAYLAGLAALSRPNAPMRWLFGPGEVGLTLLAGLAVGGWLGGTWLGERLRWGWAWAALPAAALSALIVQRLYDSLGVATRPEQFATGGLGAGELLLAGMAALTIGLMLGGLLGAWWSSLGPVTDEDV